MKDNRILFLLDQGSWQQDQELIRGLKAWQHYPLLLEAYETIDEGALFQSWVHGPGHIHRVLLLSALIGWRRPWGRRICASSSGRPATTMWAGPLTALTSTTGPGRPCAWRSSPARRGRTWWS